MNTRLIVVLALVAGLVCLSLSQRLTDSQRAASDRVLAKIRQMELYNQILPVLMSPEQIKPLLPILERHRADADKFEIDEHRMMLGLEKELDQAIADAKNKGKLPGPEIMRNANIHFTAFHLKRKALIDDTVAKLKESLKKNLNAGQIRAAAHAFNPVVFEADIDLDTVTEDKRLDLWVRAVLLDNISYPVLVELSKAK